MVKDSRIYNNKTYFFTEKIHKYKRLGQYIDIHGAYFNKFKRFFLNYGFVQPFFLIIILSQY